MLATTDYIREQKLLHEQSAYGSRGYNWAFLVAGMAKIENCKTILDYGCGKATLHGSLSKAGLESYAYDPAIPEFAKPPPRCDLVVSVDCLEHIEPDCLDAVLNNLRDLTRKILFVAISTIPAKRFLTDGRNTHLIIENGDWWRPKFEARNFIMRRVWPSDKEWVAMMQHVGS